MSPKRFTEEGEQNIRSRKNLIKKYLQVLVHKEFSDWQSKHPGLTSNLVHTKFHYIEASCQKENDHQKLKRSLYDLMFSISDDSKVIVTFINISGNRLQYATLIRTCHLCKT